MKIARWFLVVALALFSVSLAKADGIDPRFVPIGGNNSIIINSLNDFSAFTFSYTFGTTATVDCGQVAGTFSDSGLTCIDPTQTELDFINNTGQTWTSITLELVNVTGGLTFTGINDPVLDPYFLSTASGILQNGNPFVTFFGTDATHQGILSAFGCPDGPSTCTGPTRSFDEFGSLKLYEFSILTDVTDAQHQGDSFTAKGSATAAPEPASLLLALAGGLILLVFKRR